MDNFHIENKHEGMSQARIDNKGHAPCYQFLNSSFILQYRTGKKIKKDREKALQKEKWMVV